MSFQIYDERWPESVDGTFDNANGTTAMALFVATGAYGGRVDSILVSNSDTVDRVFGLILDDDAGLPFVSVNIPAGSGHGALAPVEVLAAFITSPTGGLLVSSGSILYGKAMTAPASGKEVHAYLQGGDF